MQGATNVALTAIRALVEQINLMKVRDRTEALSDIVEATRILSASRETEPFMRNALRYMEQGLRDASWKRTEELQRQAQKLSDILTESFSAARRKIAEIGSRRIGDGDHILTHCHSSAVNEVFKLAKKRGIDFHILVTETRPVYQGRITAREMLEAGIDTTMIVDSAVRSFIKGVDFAMVGADAITSEGNIINKIGTSLVALTADEARIPFYVVSTLLKFDPQTIHGEYEAIEERSVAEVWPDAPGGIAIKNPAFDVTRRDHVHGIVCEEGIISPHSILEAVKRSYPWILEKAQ